MLLEHIKGIHSDDELETEYAALAEHANLLLNQTNAILEADGRDGGNGLAAANAAIDKAPIPPGAMGSGKDLPPSEGGDAMPAPGKIESGNLMKEIVDSLEQVTRQLEAAKRGLGLVNQLPDGESRTRNRSRLMGNLNRIRANQARIQKMVMTATAPTTNTTMSDDNTTLQ